MVRHIVIWTFREDMSKEEKLQAGAKMKKILEPIKDLVDGTIKLNVVYEDLVPKSNGDIVLDSLFKDEESLNAYVINPDHVEAGKYVRSVVGTRRCINFYED